MAQPRSFYALGLRSTMKLVPEPGGISTSFATRLTRRVNAFFCSSVFSCTHAQTPLRSQATPDNLAFPFLRTFSQLAGKQPYGTQQTISHSIRLVHKHRLFHLMQPREPWEEQSR